MLLVFRTRRSWLQGFFSTPISHGSPFLKYSTAVSSSKPPHFNFIVDFLIHSVGFTRESALIATSKLPHLRCTKNPELVINIFKTYGLDNTHIKNIISCYPKILNCKPNKTLEPKFRVLKDYGFSGSDLVDLVNMNPDIFKFGLHTRIIPVVEYIRKVAGNDEQTFDAIKKSKSLFANLSPTNFKKLAVSVIQLQIRGLSNKQIVKVITAKHPLAAMVNPLVFEKRLVWIVEGLGIPETSSNFFHAVNSIAGYKVSTTEKKMKVYRSYGWSEEDIATLARIHPTSMCYSEDRIRQTLNFFMKEQGYAAGYMATHFLMLSSSLEKKVRPRYKVLQMLKEKNLVSNRYHIALLIAYSEVNFLKFLKRFENELPGLVETYANSIRKT